MPNNKTKEIEQAQEQYIKQLQSSIPNQPEQEDFEVKILATELDDSTTILTSQQQAEQWIQQAMSTYNPNNQQYSAYLTDITNSGNNTITTKELDDLADGAQSDINKILRINRIIRHEINKDDIIGKVYESITSNINTDYKLSYKNISGRNKTKDLERAKAIINDFNEQINIGQLEKESIPITYSDGTYIMCLRNKDENWVIDYYPIGVAIISDYNVNNQPVVLIDVMELTSRLRKFYQKKKNGSPLFFDSMDEDIKANYPKEVYDAYIKKEKYAKLNTESTGVIRINNMGKKYGLSPIFKALKGTLMLETFGKADEVSAKSKAKKIIHQTLRKEVLGQDGRNNGFEEMAFAHDQLMQAWRNPTVVYTSSPAVEKIVYVEPKTDDISVEKVSLYRNQVLSTLGIAFIASDKSQTASTANISLNQLMLTINSISEQLENILNRFYKVVLKAHGLSAEYSPTIKIIDSELLSTEVKLSLVTFLYGQLNASLDTCFGYLGIDIEDEKQKRISENDEKLEQIFTPRATNATSSSSDILNNGAGRPSNDSNTNNNLDKKNYDKTYNKQARK